MKRQLEIYTNWTLLGSFLIVFGSMLWTVKFYGWSIPAYDEWGSEAGWLYRHYENGSLGVIEIFAPHNGHRIVLTRLTALALYMINGGWDPQLQMVVNALLHAILCVILVRFIILNCQGSNYTLPVTSTVVLFAIPFSWTSITIAFESQFYFMLIFSILALQLLSNSRYVLGYIFSLFSVLSMTPGAFVLPAFVGAILVSAAQTREITKNQTLQCAISILLFTLFALTIYEEPATQAYHAQHVQGFIVSLLAAVSWPFRVGFGIGLAIYVPLALYLVRSALVSHGSSFLLALGLFIFSQILAMAYFRGGEGVPPADRYWEILIIGIWVNGACAWQMMAHYKNTKFAKQAASIWLLIVTIGLSIIVYQLFSDRLPNRKAESLAAQSLILEFLETGNRNIFLGKSPSEILHIDANALIYLLQNEQIREILPSSLDGNSQDKLAPTKASLFAITPVIFNTGFLFFLYPTLRNRKSRKSTIIS